MSGTTKSYCHIAGISVNSLDSEIANGGKDIRKPFDECLASARRTAPQAQRPGEKLRIESICAAGAPATVSIESSNHE